MEESQASMAPSHNIESLNEPPPPEVAELIRVVLEHADDEQTADGCPPSAAAAELMRIGVGERGSTQPRGTLARAAEERLSRRALDELASKLDQRKGTASSEII